jgi:inner membrane protein
MKGSTHLAIGGAIGVAACLYFPFNLENASLYLVTAAVSALSADLDGASLLTGKLSRLSKQLRELAIWSGILILAYLGYLYVDSGHSYPVISAIAGLLSLLGFLTKEGIIRNALVSLIGAALFYIGWMNGQQWLIGLGIFVGWIPWLDHRGMSHTIWALAFWGWIGLSLEEQIRIEGIELVAVAGYASHLIADTLTPQGVKWLYPLIKKSIKLPLV